MEPDKELRDKIVETHTTVKFILQQLKEGKLTFKDHEERLRDLEQDQYFIRGKLTIIVIAIGLAVTAAFNFLWRLVSWRG